MTVTETFKKALTCFEDFIPDFCAKLAQDGVIDSELTAMLEAELYVAVSEFVADYMGNEPSGVTVSAGYEG